MNLLVLGANSDMARALAAEFAKNEKINLILASRDFELLERNANDLALRFGVTAKAVLFDAQNTESHRDFYSTLPMQPDGVILAFGLLGDQSRAQREFKHAKDIIEVNFLGAVSILEIVAADFEQRKTGFIIGFSSVAGLRGRKSNYMYGAAKAGLTTYLSGLRQRLAGKNVRVLTVLPGFVATKMTEGMNFPGPLVANHEDAAKAVYRAFRKGCDVVYVKWFWRMIMMIICALPERIFKKTNF